MTSSRIHSFIPEQLLWWWISSSPDSVAAYCEAVYLQQVFFWGSVFKFSGFWCLAGALLRIRGRIRGRITGHLSDRGRSWGERPGPWGRLLGYGNGGSLNSRFGWGWGRRGLIGFLGMLFWSLSRRPAKQLPLHIGFLDIAARLSQQNNTIQHFQCYQSKIKEK